MSDNDKPISKQIDEIAATDEFQQQEIQKAEQRRVSSAARSYAFERRKRLPFLLQKGLSKPGRVSFEILRRSVNAVAVARICVNVLKEKVTKTAWVIQAKDQLQKVDPEKIKEVEEFLRYPNKSNETFRSFLDKTLEDLLVLDSVAWEKTRYPNGKLAELHYVDAATIHPVFDDHGNQDIPIQMINAKGETVDLPVSYVQIFNDNVYGGREAGEVVAAWPKKDMVYFNMHPQGSMHAFGYGLSPIESVIGVVGNLLSADNFNASYFEEGSFPPILLQLMEKVDSRELESMREYLYSELEGRFHRPAIVAGEGEMKVMNLKDLSQRDMQFMQYIEFMARLLAAAYGLSGQDIGLVDDLNRATSEVQKDLSEGKGYGSVLHLLKEVINQEIIWRDFGYKDIEFDWVSPDSLNPTDASTIYDTSLKNGSLTINEVRKKMGQDPYPEWADVPAILTGEGYKPIGSTEKKTEEGEGNVAGEEPYEDQAEDEVKKAINTTDNYRVFFDDRGYSQPFIFYNILDGKGFVVKPPVAVNLQSQSLEIELSRDLHARGCNVPEVGKMTEAQIFDEVIPSPLVLKAFIDYQNMTPDFDSEKWRAKLGGSRKFPYYLVQEYIEGRNLRDALLLDDMKRDPESYKIAIEDLAKLANVERELLLGDRRADQYIITADKRAWGIDYQFKNNAKRYEDNKDAIPSVLRAIPYLYNLFTKLTSTDKPTLALKSIVDSFKRRFIKGAFLDVPHPSQEEQFRASPVMFGELVRDDKIKNAMTKLFKKQDLNLLIKEGFAEAMFAYDFNQVADRLGEMAQKFPRLIGGIITRETADNMVLSYHIYIKDLDGKPNI